MTLTYFHSMICLSLILSSCGPLIDSSNLQQSQLTSFARSIPEFNPNVDLPTISVDSDLVFGSRLFCTIHSGNKVGERGLQDSLFVSYVEGIATVEGKLESLQYRIKSRYVGRTFDGNPFSGHHLVIEIFDRQSNEWLAFSNFVKRSRNPSGNTKDIFAAGNNGDQAETINTLLKNQKISLAVVQGGYLFVSLSDKRFGPNGYGSVNCGPN